MASITIVNEIPDDTLSKNPLYRNGFNKCDFFKSRNHNAPTSNRKIVPKSLESIPNTAWDSKNSSCALISKEQRSENDISQNPKTALHKSPSELNLLKSLDESLSYCSLNRKTSCKFIELPKEESKDEREQLFSGYEHLISPISTTPSIEDSESNGIIAKVLKKNKRPKLKFFCPPYFVLFAGIIEICIYVWGGDDLNKLLMYSPYQRYQAWRFISYMLLHYGIVHLSLNIIIQTLLATPLELEQGWWRCAIIYIGGGISGALGASVLQPTLYMVGSSAGVYALLVSHVANVIVQHSELKYKYYRLTSVAILALSDIAFSIAHYYVASENFSPIGWGAHFAGAISGLLIGLLIFKGCDKNNKYVRIGFWISLLLLLTGVAVSILLNVFYVKL